MKMTAKKSPPPEDLVEELDFEQRSDDWYEARIGICTASCFAAIMASGKDGGESKMRDKLLHRMAAEIIFKRPMATFSNAAMESGIEMEPKAISHYAFTKNVEVRRVGFVRRTVRRPLYGDFVVGASPDGLVNDDGVLEIKRLQPDLIIQLIDSGRFPGEHKWQAHGLLWVTGRQWTDLKFYYDEFPVSPTYRIERSEQFVAQIRNEVEVFNHELKELVKRTRIKGGIK